MNIAPKIADFQNRIANLKAELVKEVTTAMKPAAEEFFAKYPQVRAIMWTQYTPYFNDGESCEFSVHDPHVFVVGQTEGCDSGDEIEEDDISDMSPYDGYDNYSLRRAVAGDRDYPDLKWVTQEFIDDFEAFMAFTNDEETMETIFGDHTKVIIAPTGITTVEYDHD